MRRTLLRGLTVAALFITSLQAVQPLRAQITPADTAAVLAEVARTLELEGQPELAAELLRFIIRRFPDSPAAEEARALLQRLLSAREVSSGRIEFIVWNTTFGIFLGLAVPAALGAEDEEAYGVGLLTGGPAGFFFANTYSRRNSMSSGQAKLANFATQWGLWQAFGWREVLGIGDEEFCVNGFCSESTPDEAPWAALVVGGLGGLGTGLLLTRANSVSTGTAEFIRHGALWGTWYGFALGIITDAEGDALLTTTLLGGNAGLLAGLLASRAWRLGGSQVRLMSIAGVAGLVAGFGLDLIAQPADDATVALIPTITATVGLAAVGASMSAPPDGRPEAPPRATSHALLGIHDGVRLGFPTPLPTRLPAASVDGGIAWEPGLRLTLLDARF